MSDGVGGGKIFLFIIATCFGGLGAYVAFSSGESLAASAGTFFLLGLGYVVLATVAISLCRVLRWIAMPNAKSKWTADSQAAMGAVWPLPLLFWLFVTPFLAVINRVFED